MTAEDRDFVVDMAESCEACLCLAAYSGRDGDPVSQAEHEADARAFASRALMVCEGRS